MALKMNKTLPFLIFGAVLLIKQSLGEKTEGSQNISAFTDNYKALKNSAIAKLTTLSEEPLKLGIKLLQDTYDDNLDNESVKNILTQILTEYRNITTENSQSKFRLFLRLSSTFDFFSAPIGNEWVRKISLRQAKGALEKHDVGSAAVELQKTYDEFLNWLIPEIDKYSQKFTSEEQLKAMELKKWCIKFKEETNFEERSFVVEMLSISLEK